MLSLSLSPRLDLGLTIRLTPAQSLAVTNHILGLKIDLAGSLAGVKYYPENSCPSCRHELKLSEILKGYSNDPKDLNTTCPKCGKRFVARLFSDASTSGRAELSWYCPDQALYALQEGGSREMLKPGEIQRWNSSVYHSLITHFGTITKAFAKLGIKYTQGEVPDWYERVRPFLGKLPDTVIASVVGESRTTINALRKSYGVQAFNRRAVALELA